MEPSLKRTPRLTHKAGAAVSKELLEPVQELLDG